MPRGKRKAIGGLFELGKSLVGEAPKVEREPDAEELSDAQLLVKVMTRRGDDRRALVDHLAGASRANLHGTHETPQ